MYKTLGKIFVRLLFVLAILTAASVLNTCNPPSSVKTSLMTFKDDIFYFKKYVKYIDKGDIKSKYSSQYGNGSIQIYGNVIIVNKTTEKKTYFIEREEYDELEQIYTFHTDGFTITFDVPNKTLDVHNDEYNGGDIFRIDSTIKSNW